MACLQVSVLFFFLCKYYLQSYKSIRVLGVFNIVNYSEKKLLPARRSSGGCEGEGVQSYTATVLYAAKSLGKGLRGLGETVASSLTGNSVSPLAVNNMGNDVTQPGVVMILDLQAAKEEKDLDDTSIETVIAHFTAHSDAIVAMTFDLTGALLMTADKRGHDFHIFRIQPHPGGPTLAAVHHLYILHRGDTTAKVQVRNFILFCHLFLSLFQTIQILYFLYRRT